jgi:hypothetical protein
MSHFTAHIGKCIQTVRLFTANLLRLKNIGFAIWVTQYEMAPGCDRSDK